MQEFGSGKANNLKHSEVRVFKPRVNGTLPKKPKRIEPIYKTSGRAKPKKYHHN